MRVIYITSQKGATKIYIKGYLVTKDKNWSDIYYNAGVLRKKKIMGL